MLKLSCFELQVFDSCICDLTAKPSPAKRITIPMIKFISIISPKNTFPKIIAVMGFNVTNKVLNVAVLLVRDQLKRKNATPPAMTPRYMIRYNCMEERDIK